MKKINRLAAAMAVALSMTAIPQANAEIEFHPSGRGDALLFPVFNGQIENYFTIMNNHNAFIQGHLRFRGAAWSGELRDFDIILSPGDVFVFRVADIDGDGRWEIDQSLDIKNFMYTGLGGTPAKDGMDGFTCSPWYNDQIKIPRCMDPSEGLIPSNEGVPVDAQIPEAVLNYHRQMGYVEFIGEAVLDGLDYEIMEILLGTNPGNWGRYQTKVFSKRGTTAWAWSDAAEKFATDRRQIRPNSPVTTGLSDVPNALSGTAFLTIPGIGHGLAYNAEAFVNFRTGETDHRIDNYRMTGNPFSRTPITNSASVIIDSAATILANKAVIVHHEDGGSSARAAPAVPFGDYVYKYDESCDTAVAPIEDRCDEARISFNNTWGPTLADGDDYDAVSALRGTIAPNDDFDTGGSHGLGGGKLNPYNSIAEVEEAIRLGVDKHPPLQNGPQVFSAYYMDGDIFDKSCQGNGSMFPNNPGFCPATPLVRAKPPAGATTQTALTSYYLAFFPTKFYYGESRVFWNNNCHSFDVDCIVSIGQNRLFGTSYLRSAILRLLGLQKSVGLQVWDIHERMLTGGGPQQNACISPATECAPPEIITNGFNFELAFVGIHDLKNWIVKDVTGEDGFLSGRVVMDFPHSSAAIPATYEYSWPGVMYTFEWDGGPTLTNWRPMHRMHR